MTGFRVLCSNGLCKGFVRLFEFCQRDKWFWAFGSEMGDIYGGYLSIFYFVSG